MAASFMYALRKRLNLTQTEFAGRLGINQATISRVEAGAKMSRFVRMLLDKETETTSPRPAGKRRKPTPTKEN